MFEILLLLAIALIVVLYAFLCADKEVGQQEFGREKRIYDRLTYNETYRRK